MYIICNNFRNCKYGSGNKKQGSTHLKGQYCQLNLKQERELGLWTILKKKCVFNSETWIAPHSQPLPPPSEDAQILHKVELELPQGGVSSWGFLWVGVLPPWCCSHNLQRSDAFSFVAASQIACHLLTEVGIFLNFPNRITSLLKFWEVDFPSVFTGPCFGLLSVSIAVIVKSNKLQSGKDTQQCYQSGAHASTYLAFMAS
jgi:hypothetical protein